MSAVSEPSGPSVMGNQGLMWIRTHYLNVFFIFVSNMSTRFIADMPSGSIPLLFAYATISDKT